MPKAQTNQNGDYTYNIVFRVGRERTERRWQRFAPNFDHCVACFYAACGVEFFGKKITILSAAIEPEGIR